MAQGGFGEIRMKGSLAALREYEREVPKDYAEMWEKRITEVGRQKAEEERFDSSVRWGYGLYGWRFYEENGQCYEWWQTGSTCD